MTFPPSPKELDDGLDTVGFDQGGTHIKQVDQALHPDGTNFIELLLKTRVDPDIQAPLDHLLSDAIMTGNIEIPFFKGKTPNTVEALAIAHIMTQYSINGQSRMEFTRILAGLGNMITAPIRAMRGNRSNYGQGGDSHFG